MTAFLLALLGATGLVGTVLTLYYRSRALRAEGSLKAVTNTLTYWQLQHDVLQKRAKAAESALISRHAEERTNDLAEVEDARGDNARLAELLRGD